MPKERTFSPEWSERILRLVNEMKITQAGLAERVGVSPATVSRWIQGKHEPTAEGYVSLGNLARGAEGIYFWERAGVDLSNLPGVRPGNASSSLPLTLHDVHLYAGRSAGAQTERRSDSVAIPLLTVTAYSDANSLRGNVRLSEAEVEEVLLAPASWCPDPEKMIGMHLAGESMMPAIAPESILFVDTARTDREALNHKIVVLSHRDLGFKVARLRRIGGTELLIPANHRYAPMDVSNAAKWKVFGEVLWWLSRDALPAV